MAIRHLVMLGAAAISVPAVAGSVSETHKLLWAPAGKVPAMSFHPRQRTCAQGGTAMHIAGKMPLNARAACTPTADGFARKAVVPVAAIQSAKVKG